jgi:hypothetical protein
MAYMLAERIGTWSRRRWSRRTRREGTPKESPVTVACQAAGAAIRGLMLRETRLPEESERIRSRINKLHLHPLVDKVFIAGLLDSGKPLLLTGTSWIGPLSDDYFSRLDRTGA